MSPSQGIVTTGEPVKKKAKADVIATKQNQQSTLLKFFSSSTKKSSNESGVGSTPSNKIHRAIEMQTENDQDNNETTNVTKVPDSTDKSNISALVPVQVPTSTATWQSLHDKYVLVRKPRLRIKNSDITANKSPQHRQKVAAFDLDGTIVKWVSDSPGFWPSQLTHYELWNSTVITKMQQLYDEEDYLLVIFTNQGGIQGAHTGKKASLVKAIIDWLESLIKRPLIVVASTKSLKNKKYEERSFHKPTPKMWDKVFVPYFGKQNAPFEVQSSFFVGDSAHEDDAQGGVDKKFAESAGGGLGAFYTPDDFFGPSHQELRQRQLAFGGVEGDSSDKAIPKIPLAAIESRKALLGGYHLTGISNKQRPQQILILLVGVQGSGKSTFCRQVLFGNNFEDNRFGNKNINWVWLSQDTINNGKPGKREKVRSSVRKELQKGNSIVLDRMHLNPEQRQSMIENVVNEENKPNVQIHIVVFNPPKEVIARRVRNRTNHPGKVEGEKGVRIALNSLTQLVIPTYKEMAGQVRLISYASTEYAAKQLALRYHYHAINSTHMTSEEMVIHNGDSRFQSTKGVPILSSMSISSDISIPTVSLGTMKLGRRVCTEAVRNLIELGFCSIDTAPTYKNEDKIGDALRASGRSDDVFIIAKIPKRATTTEEVRTEFENTLKQLNRKSVSLLLLHWPSDLIAQSRLHEVWTCMENLLKERKCKALGVCNFNEGALTELLSHCTIPPVINQVERHPLLSQHVLLEFCTRHNILMQAHTPFGGDQGKDEILKHSIIQQVASETKLTPAQVVVKWNLQHGVLMVTKCSQEKHANEILSCINDTKIMNVNLSSTQMKSLDSLVDNDQNIRRFVAPPFMYGSKAVYCWGERIPRK